VKLRDSLRDAGGIEGFDRSAIKMNYLVKTARPVRGGGIQLQSRDMHVSVRKNAARDFQQFEVYRRMGIIHQDQALFHARNPRSFK